ncbi:uncharacterized protein LOC119110702 isoform X2 [Pollicipes pollicipes]|uniref:uncharacterized protein LOC119110702 isoform X2 n=1 Tax=Pollicipes pollicipes TaxID=41117 RepID=UPI001884B050|nr:uncharacterized protein LOC119110702 isoform X2 [Pollicipes pollicipes]
MAAAHSCASFIGVSGRQPSLKSTKTQYDQVEDRAALIGLQALTLNLASANRSSDMAGPKKKCPKPLRISTRKTPERHVSISPLSMTARGGGAGSGPRFGASPCRSDSSGFQSLPSPSSASPDGSRCSDGERLFTNRSNMQIKSSESAESVSTRASTCSRGVRQAGLQSRQSTSQPRHGTPLSRQDSHGDTGRTLQELATVFDVQNVLKKGESIEGVLRFDRRSHQDPYISAPVNLGRADGHLKWRPQ